MPFVLSDRWVSPWSPPCHQLCLLLLPAFHLLLKHHPRFNTTDKIIIGKSISLFNFNISAAFVQWTRHLSTNNCSGASSFHCFPLHHCLCRVCLQGHLAFINCQVEQWFQVDQTILIFFSFSDWHHPWWTKFWCNGLNWPNLIRIPHI